MAVELTQEDLEFLFDFVSSEDLRDSSGLSNNLDNPTWGAADQPFIRLTEPSYADGMSAPRETVNTPREISDILVNQDTNGDGVEESIPNQFGGNAFLTFFGQYFDHGLDFVPKSGSVAIGSDGFPINAQRANIIPGTGNADGVAGTADDIPAQHINKVSPYVDQNQAYGSHDAVTDLLRRWDIDENGQKIQTAYLLTGELDETGRALLPTLDHIRENYRIMTDGDELTSSDISNYNGTGQALLIDFIPVFASAGVLDLDAIGHYFIAGDGRANENVMLTSIHTIWERNHNFWVDQLKEKTGGAWTEAQYFEAARVINIAEYQRVVFTEFADAMAGGLSGGGTHGFGGYDPEINAAISAEFAHVAYRFGHSMLNETVSYVDKATGELASTSLVNAFLSPQNVAELGIANLIQGSTAVEHQAIDVHVVNALRNQLVGRPLDLAALNIFRGRDTGVGTLNEVRTELLANTGDTSLRPYDGWDDFQDRNSLSDDLMAKLKEAYPEGFAAVDLWVGGLLEEAREGQLGSTFAWIFLDQLDRLQEGDRLYYLELLDRADFRDDINNQTFSEIIARNTGLTNLPADIFKATPLNSQPPVEPQDGTTSDAADDVAGTPGNDIIDALGGDDTVHGGVGDDELSGGAGNDELSGGEGNDHLVGGAGNDMLLGDAGDDDLLGGDNDDELWGGDGADSVRGDAGNDELFGDASHDELDGGSGHDSISGGDGHDLLSGGEGDDSLAGGSGEDELDGGSGIDVAIFSGARASYNVAALDDGTTIVTHLNGEADGTDTLINIEYLEFADQIISLSADHEPEVNLAPTATTIADRMAQAGAPFVLNVSGHFADPNADDTLTYSMDGPDWLSIDPMTGVITGTPPTHLVRQELTADTHGGYGLSSGGLVEISAQTFSTEAAYHNSFGYYIADENGKPIGGAIIENNVKSLGANTATIDPADYPGAISVGFFIIPNGAKKNPSLADGQAVDFKFTNGAWGAYVDDVKLVGEGAGIYFSHQALNADAFDHLRDTGVTGNQNWEDLQGGGDKDFDDVNVAVSVNTVQSVPTVTGGDVVITATDQAGLTVQSGFHVGVAAPAGSPGPAPQQLNGSVHVEDKEPSDGAPTAVVNESLSALIQPLFNAESIAEMRYQWQPFSDGRNWASIPGATSARFTPRQSDAGFSLRVALTYIFIDSAYSAHTAYSDAPPPVTNAPNSDAASGAATDDNSNLSGADANDTTTGGERDDDICDDASSNSGSAADNNGPTGDPAAVEFNVIDGNSAAESLFGSKGADFISAHAGNDTVHGRRGADEIRGGDGDDTLYGGNGDDTMFGEGGDDTLFGGKGDDTLYGGEGADSLHGGKGDDTLEGEFGADRIDGGRGDDVLLGGADADTLMGGAGDDVINGGSGDDTLYGGAGRDVFIYRPTEGNDAIMDFEDGCDEIDFGADDREYTYALNETAYGRDYVFHNGAVLAVHSNSGRGSQNSGSRSDYHEDELDFAGFGAGYAYDDISRDQEWDEFIATGLIDATEIYSTYMEDANQPAWQDHADIPTLLGVSAIVFSHEDTNLFG